MTQLRVTTTFGQDPAYADSTKPTLINAIVRITPDMPDVSSPLNIVWVQDKSGSMDGDKLEQCKDVLSQLVFQLGSDDVAGIVTFNRSHDVLLDSRKMLSNNQRIARTRIRALESCGGTRLGRPLQAAVSMETESKIPRTIVMLTDGLSQCGDVAGDKKDLLGAAQQLYKEGGRLIVIGVGPDYDEELLMQVCEQGPDFELFHISTTNPAEIQEIVQEVMCELRAAKITNLVIKGKAKRGVQLKAITSFTPTQRDHEMTRNGFKIESGSLSTHRGQHLLLEMLVPHPKARNFSLLTLEISGHTTGDKPVKVRMSETVKIMFTKSARDAVKDHDEDVRNCIIRAEAHRKMQAKEYDLAADLYDMIDDKFLAQKARQAKVQAARGGRHATDAHRTMTSRTSRTMVRDWSTRESA